MHLIILEQCIFGQHQACIWEELKPCQPAPGPILHRGSSQVPGFMAHSSSHSCAAWHSSSMLQHCVGILWWLPFRKVACQPYSGKANLSFVPFFKKVHGFIFFHPDIRTFRHNAITLVPIPMSFWLVRVNSSTPTGLVMEEMFQPVLTKLKPVQF